MADDDIVREPSAPDTNPFTETAAADEIRKLFPTDSAKRNTGKEDAPPASEAAADTEAPEHGFGDEEPAPDDPEAGEEDTAEPDQSQQAKYVKDDAKIRLDDGTEITVKDAKLGFLRQSDYTRKMQEISVERQTVQHERAHYVQANQTVQQAAQVALQVIDTLIPQPPSQALLDSDPVEFMRQKEMYEKVQGQLGILQHAALESQHRLMADQQAQVEQWKAANWQELVRWKPELSRDPNAWHRHKAELVPVLAQYGFTPQELDQQFDHRVHKLLDDVKKYRNIIEGQRQSRQKAVKDSVLPVNRPGTRTNGGEAQARKAAMDRLKRTHSMEDGVNALRALGIR